MNEKNYEKAIGVLQDCMNMPKWKELYETHATIALAYAQLFQAKREKKFIDTIEIRKSLLTLSEEKINDLPQFYQDLAMQVDTELQQLEAQIEPDDKEQDLLVRLASSEDKSGKPDLAIMLELGRYFKDKNRHEDAIAILMDGVAIDRNWESRAFQGELNEIFKFLGSSNELVKTSRKKLSKLLF